MKDFINVKGAVGGFDEDDEEYLMQDDDEGDPY
jgi:hypothetical protein